MNFKAYQGLVWMLRCRGFKLLVVSSGFRGIYLQAPYLLNDNILHVADGSGSYEMSSDCCLSHISDQIGLYADFGISTSL